MPQEKVSHERMTLDCTRVAGRPGSRHHSMWQMVFEFHKAILSSVLLASFGVLRAQVLTRMDTTSRIFNKGTRTETAISPRAAVVMSVGYASCRSCAYAKVTYRHLSGPYQWDPGSGTAVLGSKLRKTLSSNRNRVGT